MSDAVRPMTDEEYAGWMASAMKRYAVLLGIERPKVQKKDGLMPGQKARKGRKSDEGQVSKARKEEGGFLFEPEEAES